MCETPSSGECDSDDEDKIVEKLGKRRLGFIADHNKRQSTTVNVHPLVVLYYPLNFCANRTDSFAEREDGDLVDLT